MLATDSDRRECVSGRLEIAAALKEGAQIVVTGGYFADPGSKDVPDLANVGYPIAEIAELYRGQPQADGEWA